ncbi:MAG: hypothetical protein ACREB6_13365, partial [Rhodospirillales bacterium]
GILDNRCAAVARMDSYPAPAVPALGITVESPSAIRMMEYYLKRVKPVPGNDRRLQRGRSFRVSWGTVKKAGEFLPVFFPVPADFRNCR